MAAWSQLENNDSGGNQRVSNAFVFRVLEMLLSVSHASVLFLVRRRCCPACRYSNRTRNHLMRVREQREEHPTHRVEHLGVAKGMLMQELRDFKLLNGLGMYDDFRIALSGSW